VRRNAFEDHQSGDLFVEELAAELTSLETTLPEAPPGAAINDRRLLTDKRADRLRKALASFTRKVIGKQSDAKVADYLEKWLPAIDQAADAKEDLKREVDKILGADSDYPEGVTDLFSKRVHEHLQKYLSGQLLRNCLRRCIRASTYDPVRSHAPVSLRPAACTGRRKPVHDYGPARQPCS
jgi:hypothetical protein